MTIKPIGQTVDVDETIELLQDDLISAAPKVVASYLDSWQQQLAGTEIAHTLATLERALTTGHAKGLSIEEILMQLSLQTAAVAETTTGELKIKLNQLSLMLTQLTQRQDSVS